MELKKLKQTQQKYCPCQYCKAVFCWDCRYKLEGLQNEPFDKIIKNNFEIELKKGGCK